LIQPMAYGPAKPPRAPIEFIKAMPPAAAEPVRKPVGRVQKAIPPRKSVVLIIARPRRPKPNGAYCDAPSYLARRQTSPPRFGLASRSFSSSPAMLT
jgi:hypothetical protein